MYAPSHTHTHTDGELVQYELPCVRLHYQCERPTNTGRLGLRCGAPDSDQCHPQLQHHSSAPQHALLNIRDCQERGVSESLHESENS